jgi:hypothetical protein
MTKFHTSQGGQTSIHDDELEALRGSLLSNKLGDK